MQGKALQKQKEKTLDSLVVRTIYLQSLLVHSIEYWFRCMDLDGDGFLSMYELEYFYEEQLQRMEALGLETLPFTDCLCQVGFSLVRMECSV